MLRKTEPKCKNHGENPHHTVESPDHWYRIGKLENLHPGKVAEAPEGNHGEGANKIDLEENCPTEDESESRPSRSVGK